MTSSDGYSRPNRDHQVGDLGKFGHKRQTAAAVLDGGMFSLDTLAPMRRSVTLIAMLLAMLWQSAAFARLGMSVEALAELEHAVLHWQDEAHHHHDDGSFHVGESDESARHLMADHVSVPALLPQPPAMLLRLEDGAPELPGVRAGPHPFIDGPLRPPRSAC